MLTSLVSPSLYWGIFCYRGMGRKPVGKWSRTCFQWMAHVVYVSICQGQILHKINGGSFYIIIAQMISKEFSVSLLLRNYTYEHFLDGWVHQNVDFDWIIWLRIIDNLFDDITKQKCVKLTTKLKSKISDHGSRLVSDARRRFFRFFILLSLN